jgi:predicted PurR-regulated permease PerM
MVAHHGWTRSRVLFLSVTALLLLALFAWASSVLLPFVLAAVVAYVLTPIVSRLEQRRIPSGLAVVLVYTVLGAVIYSFGHAAIPRLGDELLRLKSEMPVIAKQVTTEWGPEFEQRVRPFREMLQSNTPTTAVDPRPLFLEVGSEDGATGWELTRPVDLVQISGNHWQLKPLLPGEQDLDWPELVRRAVAQSAEYARRNLSELAAWVSAFLKTTSRAIFLFFMTLMCAAYLIITRHSVIRFFRELFPSEVQSSFDRFLVRLDLGLSGVVRGQLLICLVNGVLTGIGFAIIGLKYWPVLSLVAATFSIIPIFGSILSTVPAVAIGLTQDVWVALWVLIWIVVIHQIEANFLNPKIIGDAAKLHPVLVVFSLVLGEHHFQLWGALLAVPALSVCQTVFQHLREVWAPSQPAESTSEPSALSVSGRDTG